MNVSNNDRNLYKDGRFIFGGDRIPHPAHRPGILHPLPRLPKDSDSIGVNREHAAEVIPLLKDLDVSLPRTYAFYLFYLIQICTICLQKDIYCINYFIDRDNLGWNNAF